MLVERGRLRADPAAALAQTHAVARSIGRIAPAQDYLIDNVSNTLMVASADAAVGKRMFLFLGLPAILLAGLVAAYAGTVLAAAQRREHALLRLRGADRRHLTGVLAYRALALAGAGSAGRGGCRVHRRARDPRLGCAPPGRARRPRALGRRRTGGRTAGHGPGPVRPGPPRARPRDRPGASRARALIARPRGDVCGSTSSCWSPPRSPSSSSCDRARSIAAHGSVFEGRAVSLPALPPARPVARLGRRRAARDPPPGRDRLAPPGSCRARARRGRMRVCSCAASGGAPGSWPPARSRSGS